ncbi:MAG: hydantoinase B/oxoprolinase family protein [Phycisphaerales bacterium]
MSGWRIGVDVGGTFADCVACAPDGRRIRLKLLTDGRLRAPCVRTADGGLLARGVPADAAPALPGCAFATGDGGRGRIAQARAEAEGVHLLLEPPDADGAAPGHDPRWIDLRSGDEAPIFAARLATGTAPGVPLPAMALHIGTTRGTNALLEGELDPVAIFLNEGFEGLLEVGTQQRLGLFDLVPRKPRLPPARAMGVRGRLAPDGEELQPLEEQRVRAQARSLRAHGVHHAAVALLHAWRDPAHEERVAAILREEGLERVVTGTQMQRTPGLLPRAQTACVDAALTGAVRGLFERIGAQAGGARVAVAAGTSAGALCDAAHYLPKDSLLSGPAMGCAAAWRAMRRSGIEQGISFDMGGTSTDVARLGPEGVALVGVSSVAGIAVAAPAVDVRSIAAGGGSLCRATRAGLFVGPQSAGAAPGPACYGGGPLTVTDINLLLGRLLPGAGGLPLDEAAARAAAQREALAAGLALEPMLRALLALANEHMAAAVRALCALGGHDPAAHALVVYGGAGGQHACAVAQELGMQRILVLANAGFVSGTGALEARHAATAAVPVLAPLGDGAWIAAARAQAAAQACAQLAAQGVAGVPARASALLRVPGHAGVVEVALVVEAACDAAAVRAAFAQRFEAIFGRRPPAEDPIVDEVRVTAQDAAVGEASGAAVAAAAADDAPARLVRTGFDPAAPARVLAPQERIEGPAVLGEPGATIVVEPGWRAQAAPGGALLIERVAVAADARAANAASASPALDPLAAEELAAARFGAIAHWMGAMLERTARSVNVKDRLDFSCGLLDAQGRLCANAPHVPVHLGALGVCVRAMQAAHPFGPDEVLLTNHPAFGGSHLPDLTVARAVHDDAGERLGFVAARAHHAEVGGTRPGSMPPDARSLAEEGVVIPPTVIARAGVLDEPLVRGLLAQGPWPSRDPQANIDDLRAAIAACDTGAAALQALARSHGPAAVRAAMRRLLERSAAHTRALAARVPPEGLRARELLDDGAPIAVEILPLPDGLRIDFAGSGPQRADALNAPAAVVRSAVLYALRVLAGAHESLDEHRAPLNEGFLEPVDLRLPEGSFLHPRFEADPTRCPPVFAGNTETSQRVVDALLRAFDAAACSQGTMNNLVLGGDGFSVYETLGGGAGATAQAHGTDAVHVHMTNTRLTDPETLELRLPLRLETLQVRHGSAGAGAQRGGEGLVRRLRVLVPAQVCFLGQRRAHGPSGAAGGGDGLPGEQRIERADGQAQPLRSPGWAQLAPGDIVEVRTPGGGGWGEAPPTPGG